MLKDFVTAVDTAVVCEHTLTANGGRRSDEVHFSAASARGKIGYGALPPERVVELDDRGFHGRVQVLLGQLPEGFGWRRVSLLLV